MTACLFGDPGEDTRLEGVVGILDSKQAGKTKVTSEQAISSLFNRVFFRTCIKVLSSSVNKLNDLKASFPLGVSWQELGIA